MADRSRSRSTSQVPEPPSEREAKDEAQSNEDSKPAEKTEATSPWPGCHIAHREAEWILGVDRIRPSLRRRRSLPDISIDPKRKVMSVINSSGTERCFLISVHGSLRCIGASGQQLATSFARNDEGAEHTVIAFVIVVEPRTIMDVCRLQGLRSLKDLDLHSDIMDMSVIPPQVSDCNPRGRVYGFPP